MVNNYSIGAMSRGDIGELLTKVLISTAYDIAKVISGETRFMTVPVRISYFLTILCGVDVTEALNLPVKFQNGFVSASHFIRQKRMPNSKVDAALAKYLFGRGAAFWI